MDDPIALNIYTQRQLRNLSQRMPGATHSCLYEFGRYLADALENSEMTPAIFVGVYVLSLEALHCRKTRRGELVVSPLAGLDLLSCETLLEHLPRIAESIFHPDFAYEVKDRYKQMCSRAAKKRVEAQFLAQFKPEELQGITI